MMIQRLAGMAGMVVALAALAGCDGGHRGEAQATCSLATLKGRYIFAYDGFNVSGPAAADRLPFAAAGHETYNGDGTVSGFSTTSSNGVASAAAYSGTYTLDGDCSGTTTLTDESGVTTHYVIVVQQNGLVVGYVGTDANVVTAGYESRRSGDQGACTPQTLQRSPFAQAGVEVYRGDGTMSGSATGSSNGEVTQVSYDGTYAIASDCSGEITSAAPGQEPFHFAIYADPSGDAFAFVRIDATVVNAGYDHRQ